MTKRNPTPGLGVRHWRAVAEEWKRKAIDRNIALGAVAAFIESDAAAASYQTLGQYRDAVRKLIREQRR